MLIKCVVLANMYQLQSTYVSDALQVVARKLGTYRRHAALPKACGSLKCILNTLEKRGCIELTNIYPLSLGTTASVSGESDCE